jgi:hypothetical protein
MSRYAQTIIATGALLLLGSGAAPSVLAEVPHTSGGVGLDAREQLAGTEGQYNLKIVTAATSGAYMAGVRVIIEGAGGKRLLNAEMEGPLLLVQLPPGAYTIRATHEGDTLTRAVTIPAQGRREAMFQWDVRQ